MSQLRASINFSLREKELQKHQTQFLDLKATPNDETDFENPEVPGPNSDIDDVEDYVEDDGNDIITPEHWEQELKEWEDMLIEEELARIEEEEALRDNPNGNLEGDLLGEYIHPVIDKEAKWGLRNLFSSSLKAPNYLNITSIE